MVVVDGLTGTGGLFDYTGIVVLILVIVVLIINLFSKKIENKIKVWWKRL